MSWKRPNIGSRVNREVHARFWERAEVKFLRATRQPRPGGYRYYQNGCYQQRGDGAWVVVAPEYCAPAAAPAVEVAPPPPRGRIVRDELQDRMLELRERCEDGDRRACVRLGILIGENRERRAAWRRTSGSLLLR